MTRRIWPALGLTGLSLAATVLIVSGCGGASPPPPQSEVSTGSAVAPQPTGKGNAKVEEFDDLKARRNNKLRGGAAGSS